MTSDTRQGKAAVRQAARVDEVVYPNWEAAYKDNVGRLYRLMYARVGNRPDVEDLTVEVFRAAMGPLRLVASKGEVRSYLLMTARTVLASIEGQQERTDLVQGEDDVGRQLIVQPLSAPSRVYVRV